MNNPETEKRAIPLDISRLTPGAEFTLAMSHPIELGPMSIILIPIGEVITVLEVSEFIFSIMTSSGYRMTIPTRVASQIQVESTD